MLNNSTSEHIPFDDLFQKWNRKVYHYALQKTSSTYIAEETVQRVFIKLWKNCAFKDLPIKLEAQLFTITRSVLLDIIKEEYRRTKHTKESPKIRFEQNTPHDLYQRKETESQLAQLIEKMSPMRKQVFILSRIENLSYKQIAELLSISSKTVENHINASLKFLKKALSYPKLIILLYLFPYWG